MKKRIFFICLYILFTAAWSYGQKITIDRNKSERKEWFSDLGFGMIIHWSVDVQLGGNISDNLAGSSKDYQDQYFNELPQTFNPKMFDPEEWQNLPNLRE